MDNLKFDFHIANEQEMKLQEICLRYKKLIHQEFDGSIMEIRQTWEGNVSNLFFHKMEKQREAMVNTFVTLKDAKESLKKAVAKAKVTEEKVKETAENRTY
ncbi:MAG: hypothetical protein HFG82_13640 [Dorea sp.]|jgi:uncharacterized protein YukE|nr:hypothetical protein [Dorea sp.]GFI43360.1 hypothetical protein IMSAGC018_01029 [Lachnospiraceae bacterium]